MADSDEDGPDEEADPTVYSRMEPKEHRSE
jgi:hypothetical protein